MVSGDEHLAAGQQGKADYKMTVYETSSGFLSQLSVVNQEITKIDNVQQLCLLVIESGKKGNTW